MFASKIPLLLFLSNVFIMKQIFKLEILAMCLKFFYSFEMMADVVYP